MRYRLLVDGKVINVTEFMMVNIVLKTLELKPGESFEVGMMVEGGEIMKATIEAK